MAKTKAIQDPRYIHLGAYCWHRNASGRVLTARTLSNVICVVYNGMCPPGMVQRDIKPIVKPSFRKPYYYVVRNLETKQAFHGVSPTLDRAKGAALSIAYELANP